MPSIRPFRALRYSRESVPDLAAVVAPPYDVIDDESHRRLLARDRRNVVRLELPEERPADPPDERYRRAARLLTEWRTDGTLRRDPRRGLYPYEQVFRVPGSDRVATRRGMFARVGLERFGQGAGVRPHERTLPEPKEDRYRLLRATAVNTSPVVGLYDERTGTVASWLRGVADTAPIDEVADDDGVVHRLWYAAVGEDAARDALITEVCARAGASPITLADGHHRYETAVRYADERRSGPQVEHEPAWAEILMLLLEPVEGPLTVLATHRVMLEFDETSVAGLVDRMPELFNAEPASADALVQAFSGEATGGEGRFGLFTRRGGWLLRARRDAFAPVLPSGGPALRRLDVTLAGVALERLAGIDPAGVVDGRLAYTRHAPEAIAWVARAIAPTGRGVASAALLLEPTPAAEIAAVAADGDVMPQKSTYIYPKALTGLVINPLE